MTKYTLTKHLEKYRFQVAIIEADSPEAALEAYCRPRGEAKRWYTAEPVLTPEERLSIHRKALAEQEVRDEDDRINESSKPR